MPLRRLLPDNALCGLRRCELRSKHRFYSSRIWNGLRTVKTSEHRSNTKCGTFKGTSYLTYKHCTIVLAPARCRMASTWLIMSRNSPHFSTSQCRSSGGHPEYWINVSEHGALFLCSYGIKTSHYFNTRKSACTRACMCAYAPVRLFVFNREITTPTLDIFRIVIVHRVVLVQSGFSLTTDTSTLPYVWLQPTSGQ